MILYYFTLRYTTLHCTSFDHKYHNLLNLAPLDWQSSQYNAYIPSRHFLRHNNNHEASLLPLLTLLHM